MLETTASIEDIPVNIIKYLNKHDLPNSAFNFLKDELKKGTTLPTIAHNLNCTLTTPFSDKKLHRRLKYILEYDRSLFEDNRPYKINSSSKMVNDDLEMKILNHLIRLISSPKLRKLLHISSDKIAQIRRKYSLSEPYANYYWNIVNKLTGNYDISLSVLAKEIMTGTMLGDGRYRSFNSKHLSRSEVDIPKYRENLQIFQNLQQKPFVKDWNTLKEDIATFQKACDVLASVSTGYFNIHKSPGELQWLEIVREICANEDLPVDIKKYNQKNSKYGYSYSLTSLSTIQYYNERLRWYPEAKKIVPRTIHLKPTTVLVWLMDDGCFKLNRVVFSTHSFSKAANYFLSDLLLKTVHIKAKVKYEVKEKNSYYYLDITHKNNLHLLLEYVKQADPRLVKVMQKYYGWKLSSIRKRDFLQQLPEEREKIIPPED